MLRLCNLSPLTLTLSSLSERNWKTLIWNIKRIQKGTCIKDKILTVISFLSTYISLAYLTEMWKTKEEYL